MKQRLAPGAELDLLTEDEVRSLLDNALDRMSRAPAIVRASQVGKTDATGNLTLEVYRIPAGMEFFLTRLLVTIAGATVAVPFTAAGAMLEVLRNEQFVDFKSLVAGAVVPAGLPALLTYGEDSALCFSNEGFLSIRLTAVTANTDAIAVIQGKLYPVARGQ